MIQNIRPGQYLLTHKEGTERWIVGRSAEATDMNEHWRPGIETDRQYRPEYGWMAPRKDYLSIKQVIAIYDTEEEVEAVIDVLKSAYDAMKDQHRSGCAQMQVMLKMVAQ